MAETTLVNSPAAASVIRVSVFTKRYGARIAVAECNLALCRGEIYGLLGPDAALFGSRIHVLSHDPDADVPRISALLNASDIAVREVSQMPLTMEDVFVYRITALERAERAGATP